MKQKQFRTIFMCLFMIMLTMCGFMVGFSVNESINRKMNERKNYQPQIKIVPKSSENLDKAYNNCFCDYYISVI